MKHSHSCHSMPSGPADTKEVESNNHDNKNLDEQPTISIDSNSSSEQPNSSSVKSSSSKMVLASSSSLNTDQEALSKQLELAKIQSRSTFLDRPRAKSEELMVVKQKFPHQMPDAQKNKRQRLRSDSCLQKSGKFWEIFHFVCNIQNSFLIDLN